MPPMYRLYYYPGNANLAPHMMLEEIGAPYELVLIDRPAGAHKAEDYRRLNPMGRIPTLVDGDLVLNESAAICLHLGDRHPEAAMIPPLGSVERARFYNWLVFLTNTIQPEILVYAFAQRHTTDPAAIPAIKEKAAERLMAMFDIVEQRLAIDGPWLLGRTVSAADLFLLMLVRFARRLPDPPATRFGAIADHAARVAERPAVIRAFESEGLERPWY
jgi:glutathione S-transferase